MAWQVFVEAREKARTTDMYGLSSMLESEDTHCSWTQRDALGISRGACHLFNLCFFWKASIWGFPPVRSVVGMWLILDVHLVLDFIDFKVRHTQ